MRCNQFIVMRSFIDNSIFLSYSSISYWLSAISCEALLRNAEMAELVNLRFIDYTDKHKTSFNKSSPQSVCTSL